ncbi:MAG: Bro-N domain-containing protein [Acidithiobacillus sp.]|nr:Bro-N domain-containing protein [Acidithiobacillus sp.]
MDTYHQTQSASPQAVSFHFNTLEVRTIDQNGQVWFVAGDIAKALNYRNADDMTRVLDDDEKDTHSMRTLGGNQSVTIISESGLYHALLKSRKPEAQAFRRWVTQKVLPAIRRGSLQEPRTLQGRFLLSFDLDGKTVLQAIPDDACILSPSDPVSMATLIRDIIPRDKLADWLQIGIARLAEPKKSESNLLSRHHPGREA